MQLEVEQIIEAYLHFFKEEKERLTKLVSFLKTTKGNITDWNNFDGHITVGAFVYCRKTDEMLVLYHRDLNMYLYPGGHIDSNDKTILDASKRELQEETGLTNIKLYSITSNELVPFDIDTHLIPINKRLNLPAHYHYDFRYIYMIEEKSNINIDKNELSDLKWISINEFKTRHEFGEIINKIDKIR